MFSLWAFPSWETLATFFSRKVAWGSSIMIISNVEGPFSESSFNRLTPLKINSWNLRHYQLKMNIISTIHLHFWGSTGCKSSGKNGVCLAFEFPPPVMKKKPYDSSLEGSHPGGRLHSGDASHQYQYRKESQEGQGALMNIEMISRMFLVTCNFGWCYDIFLWTKWLCYVLVELKKLFWKDLSWQVHEDWLCWGWKRKIDIWRMANYSYFYMSFS